MSDSATKTAGKRPQTILLVCLVLLIIVSFVIQRFAFSEKGRTVSIQQDDDISYYPLDNDDRIEITDDEGGHNVVVIQDGSVFMEDADCPDKLCIKQGRISKAGQTIVCLPHHLVITVRSSDENSDDQLDAIAR